MDNFTEFPGVFEILNFLQTELFDLLDQNDNDYDRVFKNMQLYKPDSSMRDVVIEHYNKMGQDFKDNIKLSLEVFIKISNLINKPDQYEEQKNWLDELNKL